MRRFFFNNQTINPLPILGLITLYKFAKTFGKGFGFFLGLLFLNTIFMLILGFGNAQYKAQQDPYIANKQL